jgi:hypothetical protein
MLAFGTYFDVALRLTTEGREVWPPIVVGAGTVAVARVSPAARGR